MNGQAWTPRFDCLTRHESPAQILRDVGARAQWLLLGDREDLRAFAALNTGVSNRAQVELSPSDGANRLAKAHVSTPEPGSRADTPGRAPHVVGRNSERHGK